MINIVMIKVTVHTHIRLLLRAGCSGYIVFEPGDEKPAFCIWENKDADQLRGNRKADQRLCFRYIDSTFPLLSKSEISSL